MDAVAHSPALMIKRADTLYTEAMLLADEVRTYFDETCHAERDALRPQPRVLFSCEALKVTTRLMHIVSWLLAVRAHSDGMVHPLARVDGSDARSIATLPDEARTLIAATQDMYRRAAQLQADLQAEPIPSPVTQMMAQLNAAF